MFLAVLNWVSWSDLTSSCDMSDRLREFHAETFNRSDSDLINVIHLVQCDSWEVHIRWSSGSLGHSVYASNGDLRSSCRDFYCFPRSHCSSLWGVPSLTLWRCELEESASRITAFIWLVNILMKFKIHQREFIVFRLASNLVVSQRWSAEFGRKHSSGIRSFSLKKAKANELCWKIEFYIVKIVLFQFLRPRRSISRVVSYKL